jgi:hypothetical protein
MPGAAGNEAISPVLDPGLAFGGIARGDADAAPRNKSETQRLRPPLVKGDIA